MKTRALVDGLVAIWMTAALAALGTARAGEWGIHDENRPKPKKVTPGQQPGDPPSDAIVLFDGKDLSQWQSGEGVPPKWKIADGTLMPQPKSGTLYTREKFGDCQLHVEWKAPQGQGQAKANSGVFLQTFYEIQVLDNYENVTYADGYAGALYGQYPPLANPSLAPGQWQTYDVIFHAPRFEKDGKLRSPATMTILFNGVLVQDHAEVWGRTVWKKRATYSPHPLKLPICLQDHGSPVAFRNIWIRPLPMPEDEPAK